MAQMPVININFTGLSEPFEDILHKLNNLELNMSILKDIMEAARKEQDVLAASITQTRALVQEVRQLLDVDDVAGAQDLLDEIEANTEALITAAAEQATLTAEVDAANGDPVTDPVE